MLRALAKSLPSPLQRAAFNALTLYHSRRSRIDLARIRPFRSFLGNHVAVAGFFSSGAGVSRAAEFVALTLEGRGSKVARVDISSAIGRQNADQRYLNPDDCYALDISDVVFVTNPGQPSLSVFRKEWLLKRTIIGHWIWELEKIPGFWAQSADSYDEIWAATDLLRDAIQAGLPGFDRPLRVVPYAIQKDPFPEIDPARRAAVRAREQIAPGDFVVGYSFAIGSNYNRKNPEGAVNAFLRAFPDNKNVWLFLRSKDMRDWPIQRAALERAIKGDDRVRLYDADRHIGIHDFYAAIDIYLSPSRAEGYGLNLVEAAQSGLPVVTGGWRIAPEILQLPGIYTVGFDLEKVQDPQGFYPDKNAIWSRPNVDELAAFLKSIQAKMRNDRLG
jgi:glycosyltransferase involved in cell wall biosynthesis